MVLWHWLHGLEHGGSGGRSSGCGSRGSAVFFVLVVGGGSGGELVDTWAPLLIPHASLKAARPLRCYPVNMCAHACALCICSNAVCVCLRACVLSVYSVRTKCFGGPSGSVSHGGAVKVPGRGLSGLSGSRAVCLIVGNAGII